MVLLGIGIPGDGVIDVAAKSQDADHNWCPVCAGRLVRQNSIKCSLPPQAWAACEECGKIVHWKV